MDLQEIFQKMNSGEVAAHSELGTRDESKQNRNFGSRISKMKTVTGINARALVMKDVVIPFNPFTGKTDDTYNKHTPFRPILLVSQVLSGLKSAMQNNPDMKAFWEKELKVTFADGEPTMEEYYAFKAAGYIKPRIMSYPTVAMNFSGMRGFPDFKVKYTVDPTELNEQGTYDYQTAPIWHKAAAFFNSMLKAEADDVVQAAESNGANKDAIKMQRSAVFQKSPVGFVSPSNLIPFLFYPLGVVPKAIDADKFPELESNLRYYSYTDKWTTALKEAMSNPDYDEDMDFFDFTIKTPSSQDQTANGKVYTDEDANALYQAMTITNTDGRLALHGGTTRDGNTTVKNEECFASIIAAAKAYFLNSQEQSATEDGETFEKIMAASSRFRPITQAMGNFLPACNDVFTSTFANSRYFTDEVKRGHSEFFTAMNPKNAVALADADEDELESAAQQQRASLSDLIKDANGGNVVSGDADLLGVDPNGSLAEMELAE